MKRWIAALLSAVLLLSVSGAALAADPDTVEISSAEDLAELSALCTSDAWSEGKTIVLTRDISLTAAIFRPSRCCPERLTAAATAYSAYPLTATPQHRDFSVWC